MDDGFLGGRVAAGGDGSPAVQSALLVYSLSCPGCCGALLLRAENGFGF